MTRLPANTRVWLAAGHTDMRRGFDGLAGLVQTALSANPYSGHVFVFRGKRGDLIKVLWWDGHLPTSVAHRFCTGCSLSAELDETQARAFMTRAGAYPNGPIPKGIYFETNQCSYCGSSTSAVEIMGGADKRCS